MRVIVLISFLTCSLIGKAQFSETGVRTDGLIYLNENQTAVGSSATKRGYYVGPHVLGDTITMLLNKFENDYVYYEQGTGAYAVEEKKIIKPVIYKSVKKVSKYYEKKVDKGEITERNAYVRVKSILAKAIKIRNYYSEDVELDLKRIKKAADIEEYFDKIKFR